MCGGLGLDRLRYLQHQASTGVLKSDDYFVQESQRPFLGKAIQGSKRRAVNFNRRKIGQTRLASSTVWYSGRRVCRGNETHLLSSDIPKVARHFSRSPANEGYLLFEQREQHEVSLASSPLRSSDTTSPHGK